jgi:glutaredoxin 3
MQAMRQKHLCNTEGATMQIVVYTKSGCPNCVTAKRLLDSKGIGYTEMDFDDVGIQYAFIQSYPEVKQMPQIFIQGQRVGGLAGLQAALKELGL